ncbi:STM4015 family protein [Streptomyces sp. NPDC050560]|uniref:STM4015 family protein n=1 Tax=Streptomyces sp. NPDC050560 TaxID=3365630 RepID=UPI0037A0485D
MNDWKKLHGSDMGGLPTFAFPRAGESAGKLPDAASVAWKVRVQAWGDEEKWTDAFARFLDTVDTARVRALVIGAWEEPQDGGAQEVVEAVAAARDRLPALRHLFFGDIDSEECEISWIEQTDVAPLLTAFPDLESFRVRGALSLALTPLRHEKLRHLTVESGGLPDAAVREIAACDFPALVELDLWLGEPNYGGTAEVSDLAPFLDGTRLPALRSLALRNSEIQDRIAAAYASAPVVARLKRLDLSMGILTDEGAAALLGGQSLTHLAMLDLHHNYLTDAVRSRIEEALAPAGVELDLDPDDAYEDEMDDGEVWRSVAVGE